MNYVVDMHTYKIMSKTEFLKSEKSSRNAEFIWSYQKYRFDIRADAEIKSLELLIKYYERIRKPLDKNHPTYKLVKDDIKKVRKRIREITPTNYPEWFI